MNVQQSLTRLFNSGWHNCSTVSDMILQQWLARFFNSLWHDSSTVTGAIVHQSLAWLFSSGWHVSSTVAGTILQQSLYDCSTGTGMIVQQSLARLFNSYCHNSSTVTGKSFFSMLAEFFNSDVHCWRIVSCTRNTTHDPFRQNDQNSISFIKVSPRKVITSINLLVLAKFRHWPYSSLKFIYLKAP